MRKHGLSHGRIQRALKGQGLNIPLGNQLRNATDAEFLASFAAGKSDAQIAREMNIDRGTVKKRRARLTARE
jgi:DNA-binding NarL/FixJ family response regulator